MNSLHKLSVCGRHIAFALMIVFCLTAVVSAQRVAPAPPQQGKMYGDPGFRGEPINLNVVNADIRDILNYITEQYGINFVIDKSVDKVPVTVNVSEVPWNVALDSILQAQELGVQVNGSILRVAQAKNLAAEGEVRRQRQENQLDTSPLYTEFIRLNYAFGNGSLSGQSGGAGAFVGGVTPSVGGSGGAVGGAGGADQGILGIIKRRLSRRGAVEVDARSNTLIVTDVRENIDAIRQLVSLLDQPEPQVEIEARIVIATRTFSRDLGVALSALVLGSGGSGASASTLPPFGTTGGGTGGGTGGSTPSTGLVPPSSINYPPNGSLLSSIPNTVIGLTTGIFGTAQISALITAGENKGQAKTIATPRVTTLNNRPAQIESGSQIPITTVQPGSGAGTAIVATTEYVNVPLRLAVTPQITDVGTVILNVVAENNTAQAGGAISTQRMQTQVMVPDGGTTVVGGALLDSEREETDRTPGLSRIPVLGNLFKRKGVFRDSSEILFFITPRIFRPDFAGNQTPGKISDGMRSTTIMQPVPLGNPPSNSENVPVLPNNQTNPNAVVPAAPVVQTTEIRPTGSSAKP